MRDRLKSVGLLIGLSVFVFLCFHPVGAQDKPAAGNKVPDDIGIRIKNNLLDQARIQNQQMQMAQQYQANQQAIEHDSQELNSLKAEAIKAAGKDPATTDVDVDRLVYIPKTAPPKPEPPAPPKIEQKK